MSASMDLTRAVSYRGFALNTITVSPSGVVGCTVDSADPTDLEVRQFTEPLALQDGYTKGPVYLGVRKIHLTGTVYDLTHAKAFDRLADLEDALYPTAAYIASPASFGFAALTFKEAVTGTPTRTIYVRSNGLRVIYNRALFGGNASDPLAIPWAATFLAINPDIT